MIGQTIRLVRGLKLLRQLSVAVVGCGYWGPNLIRNFYENDQVQLKYICDLVPEKLTKIGRRYPTVVTTQSYSDLINDPDLDAIVVATPVHTHFALAQQALLANKHVLVEKPMCMTAAEASALVAL